MSVFLFILLHNIIPIFLVISLGFVIGKKLDINIATLSKINFYVYVPVFAFVNLYTTTMSMELILVVVFTLCLLLMNSLTGLLAGTLTGKKNKKITSAFQNSVMFYNTGNIGIPLITLVFGGSRYMINGETPYLDLALMAQIMVLVTQNLTTNSIGYYNAAKATMNWKDSVRRILRMPTIYTIPAAFLLKLLPFDLSETFIWPAFDYIKEGLISIALVTLGVQLSRTKIRLTDKKVYISVFLRLVAAPVFAIILIQVFGFSGVIAQVMMISAGLPTAVNAALIAVEYDNCPDFMSQVVITSTTLSAITLTLTIYLANLLFPI